MKSRPNHCQYAKLVQATAQGHLIYSRDILDLCQATQPPESCFLATIYGHLPLPSYKNIHS